MIISIEKAKELVDFKDWTDAKIAHKLKAVEMAIRGYTNNNFQDRDCRRTADILGGSLYVEALTPFEVGNTVQISGNSKLNKGLYVVTSVDDTYFKVEEDVKDEKDVLVTKVHYPEDVVDCAISLLEWEVKFKDKVGIQSETLSRHSVSYVQQTAGNMVKGYPVSIMSALKPYMKARF